MTMVPAELASAETPPPEVPEARLPKAAWAFYLVAGAAALAAAAPRFRQVQDVRHGWLTFAVIAAGAAFAQLFVVVAPRRGQHSEGTLSYHTTGVFLLPAALLLAPPLAALVPVVQHLPEWLKKRQPWYIATFNIFNYTLTVLAALAVNRFVLARDGLLASSNARFAVAGLAASRGVRAREPRRARGDVPARPQHLGARVGAVLDGIRLGGVRARGARSRPRRALELEPLGAPARTRSDRPHQPFARRARAAAAGAHRPEDRPLQRAALRGGTRGRALARRALRPGRSR